MDRIKSVRTLQRDGESIERARQRFRLLSHMVPPACVSLFDALITRFVSAVPS